jgi:ATP-dependent DNA helicase RecG
MLAKSVFPEAKVGLLHGRMSGAQKDEIMSRFRAREIDILVSTTVIEVGVDVPNATVMMIEDADRFGLAQLHQLRGRVGRGGLPGEVFLVSRSKAQTAIERLTKMETCDDGFELSAFDLEQRKPGDIFGTRQHGKSSIKLVNVIRDAAVIEAAYKDVREFLDTADPSSPEWSLAMRELAFTVEH